MPTIEELKGMEKAAKQGDALAQFLLGGYFLDNNRPHKAIKWLEKSAKQGSGEPYGHAQDCLSLCYGSGIGGVRKNIPLSKVWGQAAEKSEANGYQLKLDMQPNCVQAYIRAQR